jgi:hypothetical protein
VQVNQEEIAKLQKLDLQRSLDAQEMTGIPERASSRSSSRLKEINVNVNPSTSPPSSFSSATSGRASRAYTIPSVANSTTSPPPKSRSQYTIGSPTSPTLEKSPKPFPLPPNTTLESPSNRRKTIEHDIEMLKEEHPVERSR